MTTPEPSPRFSRRSLGAELHRLRVAKGIQLKDVAAHLGTSPTRAGRLETGKGRVMPRPEEIEKLCELYGVTDERQVRRLVEMLPTKRQPGWWDPYREVMPSGLEVLLELETGALSERAFEPVLVHGLLQTPDYARAIMQASASILPRDIPELVEARTKRQELLTGPPGDRAPLELWAILDESILRRPVGGPAVMKDQIAHLIKAAALPNVTLQIVPVDKGAHPGMTGAFSLLDFEAEPPMAYIDSQAGNLYLEKAAEVRRLAAGFDLLRALARDPHESQAMLKSALKENKT